MSKKQVSITIFVLFSLCTISGMQPNNPPDSLDEQIDRIQKTIIAINMQVNQPESACQPQQRQQVIQLLESNKRRVVQLLDELKTFSPKKD